MTIRLADKEVEILLGATLMHWGVPFRQATRRALTDQEQALLDQACDRLIDLRERHQQRVFDAQEVFLSNQEAALLVLVMEDCLNECGNDATEMSLQLKTADRSEVEALLERIRASSGASYAKRP